jgi:multisubunit Na+/H+ antiporter MnhE subunit
VSRSRAAATLLVRFAWQVLVAGATTAWIIARPGLRTSPGLVRMRFSDLSPTGAAFLASLVTLTPGTTAVDIDMDEHRLLLHLLDSRNPERTVARIRGEFECYLAVLFPGGTR